MKFQIISIIFSIGTICCEIVAEVIQTTFNNVFCKDGQRKYKSAEFTIVNPIFGLMFRRNGSFAKMKRFNPEFNSGPKPIFYNGMSVDDFLEQARQDSFTSLYFFLFYIKSDDLDKNSELLSFTQLYFVDDKDFIDVEVPPEASRIMNIEAIGRLFVKLLRNDGDVPPEASRIRNIEAIGRLFVKLLRDEDPEPLKDKPTLYDLFENLVLSQDKSHSSYMSNLERKNMKLILLHVYVLGVTSSDKELTAYLTAIFNDLNVNVMSNIQCVELSDDQKEAFRNNIYISYLNFPYSEDDQENCSIRFYSSGKMFNFYRNNISRIAICSADLTILHLYNCLLYDEELDRLSVENIKEKQEVPESCPEFSNNGQGLLSKVRNNSKNVLDFLGFGIKSQYSESSNPSFYVFKNSQLFPELKKFYQSANKRPYHLTGKRSNMWHEILQKLNDYDSFENQENYSPHVVHYINKEQRYGIIPGIINVMRVMSKLCNVKSDFKEIMETKNLGSMEEIIIKFFKKLSNDKVEVIKVEVEDLREFTDFGMRDFYGDLKITFKFTSSQNTTETLFRINSGRCTIQKTIDFQVVSRNLSDQKKSGIKKLGYFNEVKDGMILQSILNSYVNLLNGDNKKTDASNYVLDIAFNQGPLVTEEQKKEHLIFLYEYIEKTKHKNLNYFLKGVVETILLSIDMESPEKRASFAPFFMYSLIFLKKMSSAELENCLSLHTNRSLVKSQALCNLWKNFVSMKPINFLDLSANTYTIDDVATILYTFKDVVKHLTISDFPMSDSQLLVEILKEFLLDNKVLQILSVSSNQLSSEDIIEILKPVKNDGFLKVLNVSDNLIDAKGIRYIADLLKENGLIYLNISKNPFDNNSAEYLHKIIEEKWKPEQYNLYISKQGYIYDNFIFELRFISWSLYQ